MRGIWGVSLPLQCDPIELITSTAELVPLFVRGVFDGDPASVRPNQEQLLSVANLALREDDDAILGGNGHPLREAARGGEQDDGAGIMRVRALLNAKDDPVGLGIPIRPGATDQGRSRGE